MNEAREVGVGDLLWTPPHPEKTKLAVFQAVVEERIGRTFDEYSDFWQWSVENLELFWELVAEYFGVRFHSPADTVLSDHKLPGARWFPGARLNYAEHVIGHAESQGDQAAIIHQDESGQETVLSWSELAEQTRRARLVLKDLGVGEGDRVAGYLPNSVETVIAFLACASLGATWTCSSPDFGSATVVDRFSQVQPKVLIAKLQYSYGGKTFDRSSVLAEIVAAMPSVEAVLLLPSPVEADLGDTPVHDWDEALKAKATVADALEFASLPFEHPLWVLYSSGTTGKPKAIVHGHGGILLEHLKSHSLHLDLGPEDRFFWFTTTGWVMWNVVVGGLLTGSTIVLYDGNPAYPDSRTLWSLAERQKITYFGAGAAFLTACMKEGQRPGDEFDLSSVRSIGSTGSPLSVDAFAWCYDAVKSDAHIASSSGGTDVGGGFIGGVPTRPVRAGQLQGRMLAAAVYSFDDGGNPVVGKVGEMVITKPMPSMPLYFWNDPGDVRYRESYFEYFPGIWRHGDFLEITQDDQCVIHGRSDSTLNRFGIRIGTAEIYRLVESLPEIADSLIVNLEFQDGSYFMPMFVQLRPGASLDDALKGQVRDVIRKNASPRHVPDEIIVVSQIPYTMTGKKMEVPVKKILQGKKTSEVISTDAMRNPEVVGEFESFRDLSQSIKPA
ncbi:MAG: acetoacetate--CoA ligase [Sphingomonadaceae bacterium]|nr:acetoacetate--CoA ligase [Sphingomonadaceae bacterium]